MKLTLPTCPCCDSFLETVVLHRVSHGHPNWAFKFLCGAEATAGTANPEEWIWIKGCPVAMEKLNK